MTGQLLKATWNGTRAELLASYILTSIATATQVRREADFGLDLLCTLIGYEANVIRPEKSFGVQVKSPGEANVEYGGLDTKGRWKSYEVEWLFSQDQPILVAIADVQKWRVRLYSTSRIWYLLFQIGTKPLPGKIILVPDRDLQQGIHTTSNQWRYEEEELPKTADGELAGNGFAYRIPLGKPIVDIAFGTDGSDALDKFRAILNRWLDMENKNIMHKSEGVPYVLEWSDWQTNQMPEKLLVYHVWNPTPGFNIDGLLSFIAPAIQSLLLNLEAQKGFDDAKKVIPLARWLDSVGLIDGVGQSALKRLESAASAPETAPDA